MLTFSTKLQECARGWKSQVVRLREDAAEIDKEIPFVSGFPERVRVIKLESQEKRDEANWVERQIAEARDGVGNLLMTREDGEYMMGRDHELVHWARAEGRITYGERVVTPVAMEATI